MFENIMLAHDDGKEMVIHLHSRCVQKFLVGEKRDSRFSIILPVCGALAKCVG
jgi:hypothetical protein